MCVCSEPFHLRQPHAGVAEHLEVTAVEAEHARALHERMNPKRRREPRSAGGGQRVVGACHIVAERDGRVGPDENRPRVFNLRGAATCVGRDDEQVLRGEVVGELHRLVQAVRDDDAAVGLANDLASLQPPDEALELLLHTIGQGR